jgi:hypothetical protein
MAAKDLKAESELSVMTQIQGIWNLLEQIELADKRAGKRIADRCREDPVFL